MKLSNYFIRFLPLITSVLMSCSSCSSSDDNIEPLIDNVDNSENISITNDIIIYQVNPKLFAKGQSLQLIDQRLSEIKKLGANVLYLMPTYPEGKINSVGSPYCISNYTAVNANYGTIADMQQLVADAHKNGMRIILDWVANHTSWDNQWIEQHPEWYTHDTNGNIISPAGMGWNDVADLNFDNQEMRTAMRNAMLYWVNEIGVDGFRCDYADGVPTDFWRDAISYLRSQTNADLLMLAESNDVSMFNCGFDIVYGWNSTAKLQELYAGKATISDYYATCQAENANGNYARFITNHDQASEKCPLNYYNGKAGALSAFVLNTMMGGYPFIYSSQEVGYNQQLSFFNQWSFDFDADTDYTAEYQRYMQAFVATADLRTGNFKTYSTGNIASFYYQTSDEHGLLIMINTTANELQIKTPMEQAGKTFTNVLTNEEQTLSAATTLAAYQYLIFRK